MTTDLDQRITRALAARADGVTVTRPPLDDVLAAASPSPHRRARVLVAVAVLALLVATAAVVAVTADGDDADRVPATEATTDPATTDPATTVAPAPIPEVAVTRLPEDLDDEISAVGEGSVVMVWGGTDGRQLVVSAHVVDRSAALAEAIEARDGTAMVAAHPEGSGAGVDEDPQQLPPWHHEIPPVGADRTTVELVGAEPVLVVAEHRSMIDPLQPTRLIAFPSPSLEVRVSGTGLRLDELVGVLQGLRGDGLVPAPRPHGGGEPGEPEVAADAPTTGVGFTDLPDGLALAEAHRTEGVVGEEVAGVRYRRPGPLAQSGVLPAPPWLGVTLTRQPVAPEVLEALASGDEARILAAVPVDLPITAEVTTRLTEIGGRRVVWASIATRDPAIGDDRAHALTRLIVHLGPDAVVIVEAEGVSDADLRAAVASLVVLR